MSQILTPDTIAKVRNMVKAAFEGGYVMASDEHMPGRGKGGKAGLRRGRKMEAGMRRACAEYMRQVDEGWRRDGVPIPGEATPERVIDAIEQAQSDESQEGGQERGAVAGD